MAYAYDTYTASVAQTDFTISFPYINESDVTVYKNGVLQTEGAANDYTIVSSTIVRFNSALAGSEVVELIRSTSRSSRVVDYATASSLTEEDLDNDSLQAFYLAQETLDAYEEGALKDAYDNKWDFESKVSKNVPTPTTDDAVANKSYVDTYAAGAGNVPTPNNPGDDDKFLRAGSGTFSWVTLVASMLSDVAAFMVTFLTSASASVARTNLGVAIGADVQAYNSSLAGVAGASPVAVDSFLYTTAEDVFAAGTITAAGRSILDDASVSAMRTTLGVAIGSDVQAYDADTAKLDVDQNWTGAQRGNSTTLTSATSVAIELNDGNNFDLTLAHNATLANPTSTPVVGQSGLIVITQDGTGGRTLAFGSQYKFAGGTAPTLSTAASAVDTLAYFVKSTTEILISAQLDWS